jgi:hypothetical protein
MILRIKLTLRIKGMKQNNLAVDFNIMILCMNMYSKLSTCLFQIDVLKIGDISPKLDISFEP